ncbi:hypothetical protein [Ferrimicrobium sp.]|uniref:hypothetical protein n=1 Tax=Ferrimicrobium sp. TaxID=2926050 RepID=UPI00262FCC32|nr:hypothetical protein [Ferrimicrobium sp.]
MVARNFESVSGSVDPLDEVAEARSSRALRSSHVLDPTSYRSREVEHFGTVGSGCGGAPGGG